LGDFVGHEKKLIGRLKKLLTPLQLPNNAIGHLIANSIDIDMTKNRVSITCSFILNS
jgi:hypothetical protein